MADGTHLSAFGPGLIANVPRTRGVTRQLHLLQSGGIAAMVGKIFGVQDVSRVGAVSDLRGP
jgi:hypothetical protein